MRGAIAAALVALVALAAAAPAQAAGSPAVRGAATHPLWGSATSADNARELDLLKAAGANSVRIDVGWSTLQQDGPGSYVAWYVAKADAFFAQARARGLKVVVTFWTTPCWASSAPPEVKQNCNGAWWDRGVDKYPPTDPAAFAQAAAWVVKRWGADISAFEVWNEPNYDAFFSGGNNAVRYAGLLKSTYAAVKQESPSVIVLGGAILMADRDFLDALYDNGIRGSFDAISMRPYNHGRAPTDPNDPYGPAYSFARGVPYMRDVMQVRGDADKELWLTEIGWSSCAPSGTNFWCVTPADQAQYIGDAIRMIGDEWPYVGGVFVYNLRNTGTDLGDRESQMGMVYPDFTPKPSYSAFMAALADLDRERPAPEPPVEPPPPASKEDAPPPAPPPFTPPAEPPDILGPSLNGLAVVPRTFAPRRGRRGAAVVLRLSEHASVELRLKRLVRGRRGRRWVTVPGALRATGGPGAVRIVFGGFVDGRRLAPGLYQLRGKAVDDAGNRSSAVSTRFRVSA